MLDVSLDELAAGGAEKMLAEQAGLGVDNGHRVLQLIPKTERAARLIEPGARPHPAGQGLVDQPAVGQEINGRVRCFKVDRAGSGVLARYSSTVFAAFPFFMFRMNGVFRTRTATRINQREQSLSHSCRLRAPKKRRALRVLL